MLRWSSVHRRSSYWEPDQRVQQRYAGSGTAPTTAPLVNAATQSVDDSGRNDYHHQLHHQQQRRSCFHLRTMAIMHGGAGDNGGGSSTAASVPQGSNSSTGAAATAPPMFGGMARHRRRSYWLATTTAQPQQQQQQPRSWHRNARGRCGSEGQQAGAVQQPQVLKREVGAVQQGQPREVGAVQLQLRQKQQQQPQRCQIIIGQEAKNFPSSHPQKCGRRKYSTPGIMLDNDNNNATPSTNFHNSITAPSPLCQGGYGNLLAIDDDENTTTEEEKSGTGIAGGGGGEGFTVEHGTELLPTVPKTLRKASFCEEAIQKDIAQQIHRELTPMSPNYQNGRGSLLIVPHSDSVDGGNTRRFSLQAAAALIRRRRSSFVREKWASKLEFLLAVIGYAVDLGNIWRFPSVCYKHGGGAFLIPYLVMLLVGGLPMFYMELALGQFHRSGCLSIWKKICPMFKGIGYGICFICTFISCFYNTVIAHAVYFFISSVGWEVPWQRCNNTWNTPQCRESLNATMGTEDDNGQQLRTPSQEFYLYSVLESNKSKGMDDLGGIKPSMAFCLFLVFLIVYFALWKGPRSTGKIVWVTATAPYIVLSILLIRGLTLPGASKGIYYYLMPNFDKLLEPTVWTAAATQIFFSLGPGFGVLLALSSYNDFDNNCYRDAVVTSLINCFTSFFSGFVIFSTLGYMSELTNRPVSEVVGEDGSSLIFVVYPQAIATMNYSPIWSLIFFLMLITLGIDSTFSGIEAFITGFCDEYPRLLARRREIFVACVIAVHYIGSLPATTYGGSYVIPFLDEYGVSLSVLFIVMCEMIAVCWFYGIRRFSEDIHSMLGFYPGLYWRCCWTLCPLFIGIIFVLALYSTSFSPMQIPNYTYPAWSVWLGWLFRLLSCASVPAYALYLFIFSRGTVMQRIKYMLTAQQRPSMSTAGTFSMGPNCGGGGAATAANVAGNNNNSNSLVLVVGNTVDTTATVDDDHSPKTAATVVTADGGDGGTITTSIVPLLSNHFEVGSAGAAMTGGRRRRQSSTTIVGNQHRQQEDSADMFGGGGGGAQVNRLSIGTISASNNSRSRQSSFTSSSIAHL
ncbi:hypothetical protein niasHS_016095 [Heterodera schachtii]|uniref:Sodium-dependent serotonin transporter n=1 Tax=Heterodera schachtii TaxID=97005 RepID=A0ABD2I2A1_HETSC